MKIRVSIGRTYNIGNFESIRLGVEVEEEGVPGDQDNEALFHEVLYLRAAARAREGLKELEKEWNLVR